MELVIPLWFTRIKPEFMERMNLLHIHEFACLQAA